MSFQNATGKIFQTTTIPIAWEHLQQVLELCAGVKELEATDETQQTLQDLQLLVHSNLKDTIPEEFLFGKKPSNRPDTRMTPAQRFKVRKRASMASRKIETMKKALA